MSLLVISCGGYQKKQLGREKDLSDIAKIETHLAQR